MASRPSRQSRRRSARRRGSNRRWLPSKKRCSALCNSSKHSRVQSTERKERMAVIVRIPTPLQGLTNNLSEVAAEGSTISELMSDLDHKYPGLKGRIYDDSGKLRRFVNVYVNDEDIRFLDNEETAVQDGSEVSIIPSIAGGSRLMG